MAKDEFQRGQFHGLEIEIDGEVGAEGGPTGSEALADGEWSGSGAGWRRPGWATWRVAAWAAGIALLGFGVGALGEPAAKQGAAGLGTAPIHLGFGNQPVTAPGQAQMARLTGAAWSVTPTTPLVVHVVNDGSTTLHLRTGTLSGQHISHGTLVPDGTGVLAPGQAGTLTAQVTLECNSKPADSVVGTAVQPLTASIPVVSGSDPVRTVQLVSGTKQDDLYIASQLCGGLPPPLTVAFQNAPAAAAAGGQEIEVTVHNMTGQQMRYLPEFGFQSVDIAEMQVIGPGATVVAVVPLAQICDAIGQEASSPTIGLYMATMDGSYQTSTVQSLSKNPQDPACHD